MTEQEIRQQICDIGKRIYDRGMVAANDGNISVKLVDNEFLCTPTGISKGFMTPDCICRVDKKGALLEKNGKYRPSSEMKMHMRVYEKREDVNAVVHAHPLYATSFAIAGIPLDQPIMPEAVMNLGTVPIAPYGTPGSEQIPDSITPFLQKHDAILLEHHGALTMSDSLINAYHKMESVEFYAQMLFITKQLGARMLPKDEIIRLIELREKMGFPGKHPGLSMINQDFDPIDA